MKSGIILPSKFVYKYPKNQNSIPKCHFYNYHSTGATTAHACPHNNINLKFPFRKLNISEYFTEKYIHLPLKKSKYFEKSKIWKFSWFLKIIRFLLRKVSKYFGVIIDVFERTIKVRHYRSGAKQKEHMLHVVSPYWLNMLPVLDWTCMWWKWPYIHTCDFCLLWLKI